MPMCIANSSTSSAANTNAGRKDIGHILPSSSRRWGCTSFTAPLCIAPVCGGMNVIGKLTDFLQLVRESAAELRLVCEFRHASWLTEEMYRLLRRYGVALCLADSVRYPRHAVLTADFASCRLHGRPKLFTSPYSEAELEREARQLRTYTDAGVDVYASFNTTKEGQALDKARTLRALLGRQAPSPVARARNRGRKQKGHHGERAESGRPQHVRRCPGKSVSRARAYTRERLVNRTASE